jgi:hypothetical protein
MGRTCSHKREAARGSNPHHNHQAGGHLGGAADTYYVLGHQTFVSSQILGYNSPHNVSLLLALDCFFGQVFFFFKKKKNGNHFFMGLA